MRVVAKSLLAALVASASVLAAPGPVVAEEVDPSVVIPPMTTDPVTGEIAPTARDELVVLTIGGKKLLGIPLPVPGLGLPAGNLGLGLTATPPVTPDRQYSGHAIGLYADVDVAGLVQLNSGRVSASYIVPDGMNSSSEIVASGETPWPLTMRFTNVYASAYAGKELDKTHFADGNILVTELTGQNEDHVEGLRAEARAHRKADGSCVVRTDFTFTRLKILGMEFTKKDVAPNTTYDVPGLGQVILNEQKHVNLPGLKCGARLNAVHVKLSTAQLGLPAGADLYIGAIEAIVHS